MSKGRKQFIFAVVVIAFGLFALRVSHEANAASGPVIYTGPPSATKQVQLDEDPPDRVRTEITVNGEPLDGMTVKDGFTVKVEVATRFVACCKSYRYSSQGQTLDNLPHSKLKAAAALGTFFEIDVSDLPDDDYEFYFSAPGSDGSDTYIVFTVDNKAAPISATEVQANAPPNDLPVTSAVLSWVHDGADVKGFNAYYRPDYVQAQAMSVTGIGSDTRALQIDDLYPANWEFWVTAYNDAGESAPSNLAYKLIPEPSPPGPMPPEPDPDPTPGDILPPEFLYLAEHVSIIRSEPEPDYYYILYNDPNRQPAQCIRFARVEMEDNLDQSTNLRRGLMMFMLPSWGEGEESQYDAAYCDPNTVEFPVFEGPVWVVAENFWSDTRPMYAWNESEGTRGRKLKERVLSWTVCEDETLRTSTRSGGRDREYRYTTNADGVYGATLCWERLPDDPVPSTMSGSIN